MSQLLFDYFGAVWGVLLSLAPWLLLGASIAGLLHVVVPDSWLGRTLAGRAGVIKAVAFGVPLPLCSCGVIPAGISLKQRGASDGAAIGFLIATPQTGVDSVMVSAGMLGWPFALFKLAAAALLGIVGGLLSGTQANAPTAPPSVEGKRSWRDGFMHAVEVIETVWGWLFIGVLISAALTTVVPAETLAQLAERAGAWALVAVLLVSVPLYVCATASVPIAAALVAGGFPAGAALVFLMAGPATNVATIGAVYRSFGRRTLAVYLGTIVIGSIGLGLAFDQVLTNPKIAAMTGPGHVHGASSANMLEQLAAVLLVGMLAWFALQDLRAWLRPKATVDAAWQAFTVQGMTCQGCVKKLERTLDAGGVKGFEVQLEQELLRVPGGTDPARVRELVLEAGYRNGA